MSDAADALFRLAVRREFQQRYGTRGLGLLDGDSDEDDYASDPAVQESAAQRRTLYQARYAAMLQDELDRQRRKRHESSVFTPSAGPATARDSPAASSAP